MRHPKQTEQHSFQPSRRTILKAGLAAAVGANSLRIARDHRVWAAAPTDLIRSIESNVIFPGRQTSPTWFQPRACAIPGAGETSVLMTLQTISGSDNYGSVHWTITQDGGLHWSQPAPIASLERRPLQSEPGTDNAGWEEGVCDVVPEFHPQTGAVLAIGHNVYYRNNVLAKPQRARWPVYVVRSADGRWSEPRRLEWTDPRGRFIYTCGCAQRLTEKNGDVLIPLSFAATADEPRSVASVLCSFDGQTLAIRKLGNVLSNPIKRGLLEPSLAYWGGRYYMTIRAEDDRGYVAVSDDGLQWQPQQPWAWDDGEPLTMSTTQQRWLPHSEGLFLVYTRKTDENMNVSRWRAPLFLAAVDPSNLKLSRVSERVVFPLVGDGVQNGKHVAGMGNFHTVAAGPDESWVTVGEERSNDGWNGDTLLGRIRWTRPKQP